MDKRSSIIFLIGPTASGKSAVAIALAKRIDAEIISCDSMQIYKKMEIITSWPSARLRKKARHHLIGVIPPAKEYNVSSYRRDALKKISEIFNRGKTPLFVGGTGLYMSILLDGIFKAPAVNKSIRRRLYQEAEIKGGGYLFKRLKKVDPSAALKIHPNDSRRIVRALEVFEVTSKPISELQKQRRGLADEYSLKCFCLNLKRDKLYQRIDLRVERMFRQGLIKEARELLKLKLGKTSSYAIGLRELKGYFDGLYSLKQAKEMIKRNTRQYAKRQLTWFRKDKRIEWIEVDEKAKPDQIAERIASKIK